VVLFYILPYLPSIISDDGTIDAHSWSKIRATEKKSVQMAERILTEARAALIEMGFEEERIQSFYRKKEKDVALDTCQWFQNKKADAIFMSRHGRTGLENFFMGEISNKMVEHCQSCPVWIVDGAIKEAEKAIAQDPNWSIGYISLGMALFDFGRFEEVIPAIKTSMRLHGPYFPANLLQFLAAAYSMAGHYEKAISTYKKYFDRCKAESCLKIWHLGLAVTYIWIGQEEEARNHAAEVLMIDPKFSLEDYAKLFRFKNQADTDRVIDVLRKAGLK
jgi:tetratricopeptide (TPR) repeat protein